MLLIGCTNPTEIPLEPEENLTAITLDAEKDFELIKALIEEAAGITIASVERINHIGTNALQRTEQIGLTVVGDDEYRYSVNLLTEDSLSVWDIYNRETREFLDIAYGSSVEVLRSATNLDDFAISNLIRDLKFFGGIAEVAHAEFEEAEYAWYSPRLEIYDRDGKKYRVFHNSIGAIDALQDLDTEEYIFMLVCGLGYEVEREARAARLRYLAFNGAVATILLAAVLTGLFLPLRCSIQNSAPTEEETKVN